MPQGAPIVYYPDPPTAQALAQGFTMTYREYRTGGAQTSIGQGLFGEGWYGRQNVDPYTGAKISVWLYMPNGRYIDDDVIKCRLVQSGYDLVPYRCR